MIDLPPPLLTEALARLLSVLVPGVLGLPDAPTVGDVTETLTSAQRYGARLARRGDPRGQALVDAAAALLVSVDDGDDLVVAAVAIEALTRWVRATPRDGVG